MKALAHEGTLNMNISHILLSHWEIIVINAVAVILAWLKIPWEFLAELTPAAQVLFWDAIGCAIFVIYDPFKRSRKELISSFIFNVVGAYALIDFVVGSGWLSDNKGTWLIVGFLSVPTWMVAAKIVFYLNNNALKIVERYLDNKMGPKK